MLTMTWRTHRVERVRTRLLFLTVLALGAVAISALASGNARRVVGNCTKSQVRPSSIVVACADDGIQLTKLHWASFGGTTAGAVGTYHVNLCTPNCAAGRFASFPVRVTLANASLCKDHYDDYRTAHITFTAGRPPGQKSAALALSISCPLPG